MTNDKKHTLVEWLGFELNRLFVDISEEKWDEVDKLFQQAKEMEKAQIIDAWSNGFDEDDRATSNALKYYYETYDVDKND